MLCQLYTLKMHHFFHVKGQNIKINWRFMLKRGISYETYKYEITDNWSVEFNKYSPISIDDKGNNSELKFTAKATNKSARECLEWKINLIWRSSRFKENASSLFFLSILIKHLQISFHRLANIVWRISCPFFSQWFIKF